MEEKNSEKTLIKSNDMYVFIAKYILRIFIIITIFIYVLLLFSKFKSNQVEELGYWSFLGYYEMESVYDAHLEVEKMFSTSCGVTLITILLSIFYSYAAKTSITVTNKRVYGKTVFGKRVDLPLDSVSSISLGFFAGISVATSSGKIKFLLISNRNDVYEVISKLLVERQQKKIEKSSKKETTKNSLKEELRDLKELLDEGIISQDEFDKKKKELLK